MTSSDNNSLSQIHANYDTPESITAELIKKTTTCAPTTRVKIQKGYDNEVYEIATQEGQSFIVRIKHHGEVTLHQEEWALKQCQDNDIGVPEIIITDSFKVGDNTLEYMIQKKANGYPLAQVKDRLTSQKLALALENAGRELRKIHAIKTEGFYHRHENGIWDFTSYDRLMQSTLTDRSKEKYLIRKAGFSEEDINKMIQYLKTFKEEFECKEPVLCHGDYLPEHIFVNDKLEVTAIIDFGMFQGNHPIYDFAFLRLEAPFLPIDSLIKGYGDHEMFADRFNQRLHLTMLAIAMGHLAYYVHLGWTQEVEFMKKRLIITFQELNKMFLA